MVRKRLESPRMTANTFGQAQKELLRILTHHMIHIAGRAHVLDSQTASSNILGNAERLWSEKAVFEWKIVQSQGPSESDEDSDLFASYSSVHTQEVFSTDMFCDQLTTDFNPAFSWNPLSDPVSSDSHHGGSNMGTSSATEYPNFRRCISCNSTLDDDGLCRLCLPLYLDTPIDGILDYLGHPIPGVTTSDTQNSAVACSKPYLEDQSNWLDALEFLAGDVGEVSAQVSRSGQDDVYTSHSTPPWHRDARGASNAPSLSRRGIEATPTPITHGMTEYASSTNALESPIPVDEVLTNNDRYEGNMNSVKHQKVIEARCVCMPAHLSSFRIDENQRRQRSFVNADAASKACREWTCAENKMDSLEFPREPSKVRVPICQKRKVMLRQHSQAVHVGATG